MNKIKQFFQKNKKKSVPIFIGASLIIILIYSLLYWTILNGYSTRSFAIQAFIVGLWVNITTIFTVFEYLFKNNKVLYTMYPFILVILSLALPLLNIYIFLPWSFYLTVRNMWRAYKEPKNYGGFMMSLLLFAFTLVTFIKSVEVYILTMTGVF